MKIKVFEEECSSALADKVNSFIKEIGSDKILDISPVSLSDILHIGFDGKSYINNYMTTVRYKQKENKCN